ncbi:restriction endonuclease [Nocardiopsis algeriensis]|uniref:restriction endonuclease n=1 Tax=Nocardiopsis algeriensis TaxID=1478215 RepID=UPI003B43636C
MKDLAFAPNLDTPGIRGIMDKVSIPLPRSPLMAEATPQWKLKPGEKVKRKLLHDTYAGSRQGGICPSAKSPNILIFSNPEVGEKHGYHDAWMSDGCFHYTGEGQYGDQSMTKGNLAILNHAKDGRALRVFQGSKDIVVYQGEFSLDDEVPWYETDAPETDDGPLRKVIVFKLRPVDTQPPTPESFLSMLLTTKERVKSVPIEEQKTEEYFLNPNQETSTAKREESTLVSNFSEYLQSKGLDVERLQITPDGERSPLFTDLYVRKINLLAEAKGSTTRENIRMAIGQLADYKRFVSNAVCAILTPSKPRPDLMDLVHAQGYTAIWPEGNTYKSSNNKIDI